MWGWLWLSNSASHSPRIVRQIALTQQNAFLWVAFGTQQNAFLWVAFGTQQNAFLWVAFGTQQNALYGSRLELSRTLSYGSRSRLKLKAKYHITFLSYNLLTKTENAAGFIQAFLL
ncbi:hypothetical protein [Leptospira interrogans]|uniref:hypothetical protein n=1 Tax=Leptospira interrogans TaxID=173 RepID=UPI001F230851|nr:hypothetical protein [Leptospira interrogans]